MVTLGMKCMYHTYTAIGKLELGTIGVHISRNVRVPNARHESVVHSVKGSLFRT